MKTLDEIKYTPRLNIIQVSPDGGVAYAELASSPKPRRCTIIFSWGGGWDHVSVSFPNRCPTWEEMCEVKRLFFRPDETVVQYHPAEDEYINAHPYCLHLWRKRNAETVLPPYWMIGPKKGQTVTEVKAEALLQLLAAEAREASP